MPPASLVPMENATRFMNVSCDQITAVRSLSYSQGGREIRDAADNDKEESIVYASREPWTVTVESRQLNEIIALNKDGFEDDKVKFTVYGRKKLEANPGKLPSDMNLEFTGCMITNCGDNGAWGDLRTGTLTFFASDVAVTEVKRTATS